MLKSFWRRRLLIVPAALVLTACAAAEQRMKLGPTKDSHSLYISIQLDKKLDSPPVCSMTYRLKDSTSESAPLEINCRIKEGTESAKNTQLIASIPFSRLKSGKDTPALATFTLTLTPKTGPAIVFSGDASIPPSPKLAPLQPTPQQQADHQIPAPQPQSTALKVSSTETTLTFDLVIDYPQTEGDATLTEGDATLTEGDATLTVVTRSTQSKSIPYPVRYSVSGNRALSVSGNRALKAIIAIASLHQGNTDPEQATFSLVLDKLPAVTFTGTGNIPPDNAVLPWYTQRPFDSLLKNLLFFGVILVVAAGVVFFLRDSIWRFVRRKFRRRRPIPQQPPGETASARFQTVVDNEGNLRIQVNDLKQKIEKLEGLMAEHYDPKLKDIQQTIGNISNRVSDLERKIPPDTHALVQAELSRVAQTLQSTARLERSQSAKLGNNAPKAGGLGLALAAVVNRWLEKGGTHRATLIKLAVDVGLRGAELVTLDEAERSAAGMSSYEYTFRSEKDGSWLKLPVNGGPEIWVVPADAQLMGSGTIPGQLAQLFDGFVAAAAGSGFRFESIFRPCRLRPTGTGKYRYTKVEGGALKLKGSPATSDLRAPVFEDYLSSAQYDQPYIANQSASLDGLLANWIQRIDERLEETSTIMGLLNESNDALRRDINERAVQRDIPEAIRALQLNQQASKKEFTEALDPIRTDLALLKKHISDLSVKLSDLSERLALPREPLKIAPEPHRELPAEPAAIALPQPTPPRAVPLKPVLPELSKSFTSVSESPAFPAPPLPERPAVALSVPPETVILPPSWRHALTVAHSIPTSDPETTDVAPSVDVYTLRLRNLREALMLLDSNGFFSVVHVKNLAGDTVQIHETSEAPSEFVCNICKSANTWQMAVVAGKLGTQDLYLLYPSGTLNRSSFPPGYSALIETKSPSFSTASYEPAQLRLQDSSSSTYSVLSKMRLYN